MFILTNNDRVFAAGETIDLGVWENDPTRKTYRIKNGEKYSYAVQAHFKLHEVDSLPEDYERNKYTYTEKEGFRLFNSLKEN